MKESAIELKCENGAAGAILLRPDRPRGPGIVLAHGAGGNMNVPFVSYFHRGIADAGYACLKFNFVYSQQRRRYPDRQPALMDCFRKAMDAVGRPKLVLGGKSMGGRIASYVADDPRVAGLFFLGYPLHPPGKTEQLRDAHLYAIRKPMLFAGGTQDPFARMDLLDAVIRQIGPFASTHFVEGGGHSFELPKKSGKPPATVQSEVLQALLKWLEQFQPGAAPVAL